MSRPQLQDSEVSAIPDKAMLATVLNYLKNKNLKETVEVLQKELSTAPGGDSSRPTSSMHLSSAGQSGTEPIKYEESYTSQAPLASSPTTPATSTAAYLKLANSNTQSATTSLSDVSQHEPIPAVPSLKAFNSPVQDSNEKNVSSDQKNSNDVEGGKVTSPVMSPPPLISQKTATTIPLLMPTLSTPLSDTTAAATKATLLDKNPLWFQSSTVSSSSGGKGVLLPQSFVNAVPLNLGRQERGSGLVLSSPPAAGSSPTAVGGQNLPTGTIHPAPSLMYQLMATTPTSGTTRPFLGANGTVLTVLPSPPTTNLVNPQSVFLVANQNLGGKTLQTTPTLDNETEESMKHQEKEMTIVTSMDMEPSTGQAEYRTAVVSSTTNGTQSSHSPAPHPRTLASIPISELTPQHLELKAFAEDFKTRRIRLGFTQGAVGTSLAEKGYNNFAQSTISRFEQMQLSPANAATIRVILEKWLLEAESPDSVPANQSNDLPMMAGRKRKKRAVFTPQTKSTLDEFFVQNQRPNRQAIESISQKLDLLPEEVRVWFCNKRQKSKSGSVSTMYERESSSTTSSGVPSPTLSEGSISQRRQTPSPKTPKTPFTIEELSKSSSNRESGFVSSPMHLSTSSLLPLGGLVASVTPSVSRPLIFASSVSPPVVFGAPAVTVGGSKSPPLVLPQQFLASSPIINERA